MLEKMGEFFDNRLDIYDDHQLNNIDSAREFYEYTAKRLPMNPRCSVKKEQNINDNEFYHYDTPLTVEHEVECLTKAGFSFVQILNN